MKTIVLPDYARENAGTSFTENPGFPLEPVSAGSKLGTCGNDEKADIILQVSLI